MSVVINTNTDSIKIQHSLTNATTNLSTSMQRMSTGLKVLSAKDDAAGTVIAARMAVQLSGNAIAQNNVQNGNAMLATAESSLDVVESNLSRIRDLTLQAKNGTYSQDEIKAMDDEAQALMAEIDRIGTSTKYSSLKLFDDDTLGTSGVTFQVGANSSEDNTIKADEKLFKSVSFVGLTTYEKPKGAEEGTDTVKVASNADFSLVKMYNSKAEPGDAETFEPENGGDLKDPQDAFALALDMLDAGITNITERKSIIGASENRLASALETLNIQQENLSSAKSIITDADIAAEASNFTQQQILQQVSTSLLAQANQAPAIALSLI